MSSSRVPQSPSVRPGLRLGAAAIAIIAVGVIAWLVIGGGDSEGGSGAVVTEGATGVSTGPLPEGSAPSRGALIDEADGPTVASEEPAEESDEDDLVSLDDYEHHEVRGLLSMDDGSWLPDGITVSARFNMPFPRVASFSDLTSGAVADSWDDAFAGQRDRLVELTKVEVADDGTFVMSGVPAAGAWLAVHHDWVYLPEPIKMEANDDQITAVLTHGSAIRGRVLDAAGTPLAGVEVSGGTRFNPYAVFDSSAVLSDLGETETDADGRFRLGPTPPEMELVLRAKHPDYASARERLAPIAPGEERLADLVMLDGGRLSGHVVITESGEPAKQQRVLLRGTTMSLDSVDFSGDDFEVTDYTDGEGVFSFRGITPGDYEIVLTSLEYRTTRTGTLTIGNGTVIDDIVLQAEPGLTVSGIVVGPDGEPLDGAYIKAAPPASLTNMGVNWERELRQGRSTDEDGHFEIAGFEPGRVEITARLSGFVPHKSTVDAGTEDLVITLDTSGSVSGIAVSLVDGEPVPRFSVKMTPAGGVFDFTDPFGMEDRFRRVVRPQTFIGETGEFELLDVQPGMYDLKATADGFTVTTLEDVEVLAGEPTRGVVVMMPAEARVMGRIVSSKTGMPVTGATVSTVGSGMMAAMSETMTGGVLEARTDDQGAFTLGGLGEKTTTLTVKHPEHQDLGIDLEEPLRFGEQRDVGLLKLSTGAAIWGHVYDDVGRGTARVPILVSDPTGQTMRNTQTDADGAYRVAGLPPGTYNVMRMDFQMSFGSDATLADFTNDIRYETVQIATDEEKEVDLGSLPDGVIVHGVVRPSAGGEVLAMVTMVPVRGSAGMKFAYTDEDGAFEIENVVPGDYTLSAIPMDKGMAAGAQPTSSVVQPLHVTSAPRQRHDIELPGGTLNLIVVDARDGKAVDGVRVVLERTDPNRPSIPLMETFGWRVGEVYTDDQGEATFRHLPDGTYTAVAGGKNMLGMGASGWAVSRVHDIAVQSGVVGFTVRVEVDPAGRVEGVVRDSQGRPLVQCSVWAADNNGVWLSRLSEVQTDSAGRYAFDNLDEGTWKLAFRDADHAIAVEENVTVRTGETSTRDVTLKPGVRVLVETQGTDPWASVQVQVSGPSGPVPTSLDLGSVVDVFSGSDVPVGTWDLGRFEPGSYTVLVFQGQEVVAQDTVGLSLSTDPYIVRPGAP